MSGKVLSRSSAMQLHNIAVTLPLMRPSLKLYFIILALDKLILPKYFFFKDLSYQ